MTRPSSGSVFTEPLQSPAPKADGAAGVAVHPSGDSGEAETICRQLEGPGDARAGGTGASGRVPTVFPGNTVGTQHPSPSPGGLALWWELRPSSPVAAPRSRPAAGGQGLRPASTVLADTPRGWTALDCWEVDSAPDSLACTRAKVFSLFLAKRARSQCSQRW